MGVCTAPPRARWVCRRLAPRPCPPHTRTPPPPPPPHLVRAHTRMAARRERQCDHARVDTCASTAVCAARLPRRIGCMGSALHTPTPGGMCGCVAGAKVSPAGARSCARARRPRRGARSGPVAVRSQHWGAHACVRLACPLAIHRRHTCGHECQNLRPLGPCCSFYMTTACFGAPQMPRCCMFRDYGELVFVNMVAVNPTCRGNGTLEISKY